MFAALASMASWACLSRATTWLGPQRALSPQEWLSYDLSGADVAGVCTLLAVRDTVVDIASDGSGIAVRSLVLSVTQWLKGDHTGGRVEVGLSPLDENPLRGADLLELVGRPQSLLFLARATEAGFVLCDGPDPSGVGLRSAAGEAGQLLVTEVRRLVAHDRPEALLGRSDAVVVGEFVGSHPCGSSIATEHCARVRVVERLRGAVPSDTISVSVPRMGDVPDGPALFVLSRRGDGVYETLGFQSGSQVLSKNVAARWRLTLAQVRSAIARLGTSHRTSRKL
jgi:hypothetical protein